MIILLSNGGLNEQGQLEFPSNIIKIKDVVAGRESTFAIKDDGSVIGFGNDQNQQISGIPTGLKSKKIGLTQYQCVAIKKDGTIAIWGKNNPNIDVQLRDAIPSDFKAKDLSVTDGNYTLDRQPLNLVSMDHCTAGTTKKVYSIIPVKATATDGKVNHKTKKVRLHKRKQR